jgi:hypothetical protein
MSAFARATPPCWSIRASGLAGVGSGAGPLDCRIAMVYAVSPPAKPRLSVCTPVAPVPDMVPSYATMPDTSSRSVVVIGPPLEFVWKLNIAASARM